ncbi:TonB-dependent receptor [uncultured Sunxiuqinia sp.]|uniref:TonB-dependent receptor n=1 Tax=uncultured Sunxiuqinia sp. TaxID=1573825 RepID=UPI00260855FA|nr:TonB-dependent receptor [uncultured Sunxiuqinia sp.]
MKLFVLLMTILISQTFAISSYSQDKLLSLRLTNSTVKDALIEIEKSSEFYFLYSNLLVDVDRQINVDLNNKKIEEVLADIFQGTETIFVINDRQIILKPDSKDADWLGMQQKRTVAGKVVDENGQPLPGVTVLVKGTTQGTVTDFDGNYTIDDIPSTGVLIFSFVGMQAQEIVVGNQMTVNVTMAEDAIGIEEVVAVGYGVQKKSDITGAITSVDKEVLEKGTSANLLQTLQGRLAGINITNQSASAEQNAVMMVRGPSSLKSSSGEFNTANAPLIIVDGIPYSGSLSSINPIDVESIEVLKDASSSAIYGTRSSNGVILISTKKGEKGKISLQYRGTYGISEITNIPHMMSAQEFYDWKLAYDESASNDPTKAFTTSELENYNNGVFTDWIDLGTRTGNQQEHTFSISGGSERNKYYFSANVLQVEGIAENDKFDRYSYRLNLEQEITKWLKFGTNTNMLYANRDGKSIRFHDAFYMNPLVSPYDENGEIKINPWPEDVFFDNPLEPLNHDNQDREYKVITNNYIDLDVPFVKGLNYRLNTGILFLYRNMENYEGAGTKKGFTNNGALSVDNRNTNNYTVENILTYKRRFDDHSLYFTGLYSFEMNELKIRKLSASNFPLHILGTYGAHTGGLIIPDDGYSKSTISSLMGRLNYNYKGKYLLTGTVRRDGYSAFGDDTKYGIFPSVAIGWNIGDEAFIDDNISWIDQIKLRGSWGRNGNQAVSSYSTLAKTIERSYLGGSNATETAIGYVPGSLASPDLGWEFSTTINAGIDFSLNKGRFSGSFEIYKKESEQILEERIPAIYGVIGNKRLRNIGITEVKGLELTLNTKLITNRDFSWDAGIVIDGFRDKIVSLTQGQTDDVANKWFIGEPFIVYYGYEFDGIWQEGDNIVEGREPGDVKVKDYFKDGVVDMNDRHIIGQYYPDFSYSINTNFKYKNLSVDMLFQGVYGNERPNGLYDYEQHWDARRNSLFIKEYWTPDNPINTYHSNKLYGNHPTYHVDFFEDASYLRFKNLNISYDFTHSKLNVANFAQLNLFFNGSNLFTLSKWTGLDPEFSDQTSQPLSRTYLIGVNVTL